MIAIKYDSGKKMRRYATSQCDKATVQGLTCSLQNGLGNHDLIEPLNRHLLADVDTFSVLALRAWFSVHGMLNCKAPISFLQKGHCISAVMACSTQGPRSAEAHAHHKRQVAQTASGTHICNSFVAMAAQDLRFIWNWHLFPTYQSRHLKKE